MDERDNTYEKASGASGPQLPERDWFLQMLVGLVNENEGITSLPLTIVAGGGAVISGDLVSFKSYFRRFGETMSEGFEAIGASPDLGAGIKRTFTDLGDTLDKQLKSRGEDEPASPAGYLHLTSARIISPSGNIPSETTVSKSLWRCRISMVDAFMLGTLGPDGPRARP